MITKMLTARLTQPGLAMTVAAAFFHAASAQASGFVTEQFEATVSGGPFDGVTGLGSFTYAPDQLREAGEVRLTAADGLSVSFTLFGQTFTETDDAFYGAYPRLWFLNRTPILLDFMVSEQAPAGASTAIAKDGIFDFWVYGRFQRDEIPPRPDPLGTGDPSASPSYRVALYINTVPEPSGTGFALVSGLGLGFFALSRRLRR